MVGWSESKARAALDLAGFGVTVNKVDNSKPKGTVVSMTPSGVQLEGSTITLNVSTGKAPTVEMTASITVTNSSDENVKVSISAGGKSDSKTVKAGGTGQFTINFTAEEGKDVTVSVSAGEYSSSKTITASEGGSVNINLNIPKKEKPEPEPEPDPSPSEPDTSQPDTSVPDTSVPQQDDED